MSVGRTVMGAACGLLIAVILIAGVSIAGGGSLHLDLAKAGSTAAQTEVLATQTGQAVGSVVAPQAGEGTNGGPSVGTGPLPVSDLSGLAKEGSGTIGLLLLPVALGAVFGLVFYGAYARRVDAE